jgi:two-component system response regulator PilR (NtrC family)
MPETNRVLIIDDEPDIRELLSMTLSRMNLDCETVGTIAQAHDLLNDGDFDLCLTDMRLPDGNGIELVRHIQEHHPELPVAVITAFGSVDTAVEALKAGAFDFVSKPVQLDELRQLVTAALKLAQQDPRSRRSRYALLGNSRPMRQIRAMIAKLARSQAPVYVRGESGTGKELVARLIHEKSARAEEPFVAVNCGAIPTELMESEFFGHKKGSFTGAIADKPGLFQAAHGGTLFLDEVAELPVEMQVKLLRAIQEKAVRPVGGQSEIPINVRLLSASQVDLADLVQERRFRQDFYYRINVIELRVPSLRERGEDIPELANHFLNRLSLKTASQVALSEEAYQALKNYPFPGNVRELENILERALALCEGDTINVADLALPRRADGTGDLERSAFRLGEEPLETFLERVEKAALSEALGQTGHNKTAAAKLLGMSFRSLRYKLDKFGIE